MGKGSIADHSVCEFVFLYQVRQTWIEKLTTFPSQNYCANKVIADWQIFPRWNLLHPRRLAQRAPNSIATATRFNNKVVNDLINATCADADAYDAYNACGADATDATDATADATDTVDAD